MVLGFSFSNEKAYNTCVMPVSSEADWLFLFKSSTLFDTRKRHPQPEQKQSIALFAVQGGAVVFEMDCFCNKII
ncbi:hypothetical protein [Acinetobacter sp.]|uniref:hypothetical protein n=1 Tax=Acinetobacter sp. TaxID=472 RepID=UPI0035B23C13